MDKRSGTRMIADYSKSPQAGGSYLKVYIRLRPSEENGSGQLPYLLEDRSRITIKDASSNDAPTEHQHVFSFHRVYEVDTTQEEVFREVAGGMATHAFRGYNACCFAYGQTGSGKTHTMIGPGGGETKGSECGIIPRAAKAIFEEAASRGPFADASIAVSLCEIYCDRIRDLGKAYNGVRPGSASPVKGLGNSARDPATAARMRSSELAVKASAEKHGFGANDPKGLAAIYHNESLELHEDSRGQVYVKDLTTIPVHSVDEVLQVIETGFKLRATHETRMNATSSRSHTIFTFHVSQKDRGTGQATISQVHFVDLAGSERLAKSESAGQRLAEAQYINLSLTHLGKVVASLQTIEPSEGPTGSHIPYRDSKLTRLLQNSLGGNSYTTLVATVHPRASDMEETVSTLQFANRCQSVLNRPRVNYLFPGAEDVAVRLRQLESELAVTKYQAVRYRLTSALRMMRLLAEAGVNGALLPDGRFMTVQGIIVGVTEEEASSHPYVVRALALLTPEPSEEDQELYKEGQEMKAKLLAEVLAAGASRSKGLLSGNVGPGGAPMGAPLTEDALSKAVAIAITGMATAGGIIGAGAPGAQNRRKGGRAVQTPVAATTAPAQQDQSSAPTASVGEQVGFAVGASSPSKAATPNADMPIAISSPSGMALAQQRRNSLGGTLGHRPVLGGVSGDAGDGISPSVAAAAAGSPSSTRPSVTGAVPSGANPAIAAMSLPNGRQNVLTTGQARAGFSPAEYAKALVLGPNGPATVLTSTAMSGAPIGSGSSYGLGGQLGGRLGALLAARDALTPEVAEAEIAKLKNRIHELKKELDDAKAAARKEQQWLLSQERAAKSAGERAQAEAAEKIRQAKEMSAKAADEHARQVASLIRTTNYVSSEQDRIAASTPKSLVPYLLQLAAVGRDQDLHNGVLVNTQEAAARAMEALDVPLAEYGVPRPLTPATARRAKAASLADSAAQALTTTTVADPTLLPLATAPSLDELRHAYAEAVAKLRTAHSEAMQQVQQEHMSELHGTRQEDEAVIEQLRTQLSHATHEIGALQGQISALQSHVQSVDAINRQTLAVPHEAGLGVTLTKATLSSPGSTTAAGGRPMSSRPSTAGSLHSTTRPVVEATPVPASTMALLASTQGAAARGSAVTAVRAGSGSFQDTVRPTLSSQASELPPSSIGLVNGRLDRKVAKELLNQALSTIGPASHGPKPGGQLTPGEAASVLAQATARAQAVFDREESSKRGILGTAGMSPGLRTAPAVTRVTSVASMPWAQGGRASSQSTATGRSTHTAPLSRDQTEEADAGAGFKSIARQGHTAASANAGAAREQQSAFHAVGSSSMPLAAFSPVRGVSGSVASVGTGALGGSSTASQ